MRALIAVAFSLCLSGMAFAEPMDPRDLGKAPPQVKLLAVFCLKNLPEACVEHEIAYSKTVNDNEPLFMSSCMTYAAQTSIIQYVVEHRSELSGYVFDRYRCKFGNKDIPDADRRI